MAKLLFILIVGGALSEAIGPAEPPLLIDPAPVVAAPTSHST